MTVYGQRVEPFSNRGRVWLGACCGDRLNPDGSR